MATKVNTGTQAQVTAANSITTNSPSATVGNTLVLIVGWIDTFLSAATSITAPGGWSIAYNPTSSCNAAGAPCGFAVFYKTAAGGVESPVINEPGGAHSGFFANAIITEWSGMGSFDSAASSSSVLTNNAAASTTGGTVPNTGTLANANSTVFTGVAIESGVGLANAAIAFSGGGWTTEVSDQHTDTSVGSLFGDKVVSATTPIGAVYTWTSDSTMASFQAASMVFSDSSGGGAVLAQCGRLIYVNP